MKLGRNKILEYSKALYRLRQQEGLFLTDVLFEELSGNAHKKLRKEVLLLNKNKDIKKKLYEMMWEDFHIKAIDTLKDY